MAAVVAITAVGTILSSCAMRTGDPVGGPGPLYLTIVVHNEEDVGRRASPKPSIPDYDGDEQLLRHFAAAMRAFAAMAADHGARISFGSDWTFSRGVAAHDPAFYQDLEAMGHEVDAHAHESHIPYPEVREEIQRAGGNPTAVASGLNEREIHERMAALRGTEPPFRILWGVALPGHGAGECIAGWAWRPSRDEWTVHDPDGAYLYIGHGDLVNSAASIRRAVADRQPGRINTYAVFVAVREFLAAEGDPAINDLRWTAPTSSIHYCENLIDWWDAVLSDIDGLVASGDVVYASLTQIAAVFEAEEDGLVFTPGEPPRSDAPLRARNVRAGYPAP
jgi:hypothetical protein